MTAKKTPKTEEDKAGMDNLLARVKEKREAAKAQHEVSKPYTGEKMVVPQSVGIPSQPERKNKGPEAKASLAKVNRGSVERGDRLATKSTARVKG